MYTYFFFFFFLGEPLTVQEAFIYMKFLIGFEENFEQIDFEHETSMSLDFTFLPEVYIFQRFFLTYNYYLMI